MDHALVQLSRGGRVPGPWAPNDRRGFSSSFIESWFPTQNESDVFCVFLKGAWLMGGEVGGRIADFDLTNKS